MNADFRRLLGKVDALLLDFDGPVCSIFAGYPAPKIAAELVDVLQQGGATVPPDLASEPDPLEVLRRIGATGNQSATRAVENALCAAERQAAESAEPTPYGREVIVAARQAGLVVAVVSNNSSGAVTAYLTAHRLIGHVSPVIGRPYADPARMKPNPKPILQAVHILGIPPSRCVLVGDSLSDIEGAKASGVHAIGFANRPTKVEAFRSAMADVVMTSMRDLAEMLIQKQPSERPENLP
jgi:HAD superfamily hydrolase (TIGR01509 family)